MNPRPRSRSALSPGRAERASLPTMKRRANDSISARTTRAAAGRRGERRPVAPIARRSARGGTTPACRKYSRRWRAISAPPSSVGKTSTKRKSSTLSRSSAMAQSIISPCQRAWESSDGRDRSTAAKRARAVAWMSASRATASAPVRGVVGRISALPVATSSSSRVLPSRLYQRRPRRPVRYTTAAAPGHPAPEVKAWTIRPARPRPRRGYASSPWPTTRPSTGCGGVPACG